MNRFQYQNAAEDIRQAGKRRQNMNHFTTETRRVASISGAATPAWRSLTAMFAFIAMLLVLATGAWAQDNAVITGTVSDSSGAVVANAAITLTNTATGQIRQSTSNTSGSYQFPNVGVGTYTLAASVTGFQKYNKTGIEVHPATTLAEDVTLSVGKTEESVTVAADALQVQSESNEISNLISGEQVTQLATNGRNVTSLAARVWASRTTCPLTVARTP